MNATITTSTDFTLIGGGSVFVLTPETDRAREWVEENVGYEDWQMMGRGIAIEHRYVEDLVDGILEAGFTIGYQGGIIQKSA